MATGTIWNKFHWSVDSGDSIYMIVPLCYIHLSVSSDQVSISVLPTVQYESSGMSEQKEEFIRRVFTLLNESVVHCEECPNKCSKAFFLSSCPAGFRGSESVLSSNDISAS